MRKEGTFEGVGGVDVSDNGGRFWFLETILKHKHSTGEEVCLCMCTVISVGP